MVILLSNEAKRLIFISRTIISLYLYVYHFILGMYSFTIKKKRKEKDKSYEHGRT